MCVWAFDLLRTLAFSRQNWIAHPLGSWNQSVRQPKDGSENRLIRAFFGAKERA